MKFLKLSTISVVCLTVVGCDSESSLMVSGDRPDEARPFSSHSIDVFNDEIATLRAVPNAQDVALNNILTNPSFENKLSGWTACDTGLVSSSSDASAGSASAELQAGTCMYQSVDVIAGKNYVLSCSLKLTDHKAWTGMGMTVSNAAYKSLEDAPVAVATSEQFSRLETMVTAPTDSSFIGVWMHTDNGAVVDDCSLVTVAELPSNNDSASNNGDLLTNGAFESVSPQGFAEAWSFGCKGSAVADGSGLVLSNGSCIDQSLLPANVAKLASSESTFSCLVEDVKGYADLSVFLDGKIAGNTPMTAADVNSRVEVVVPASSANTGFVSLYGDESVRVSDCKMTLATANETPLASDNVSIDVRSNLEGADYWIGSKTFQNQITVINTGSKTLFDVSVKSDVLDSCSYSYPSLAAGESVSEVCVSRGELTGSGRNTYTLFEHVMTATAVSDDGISVTDSDFSRVIERSGLTPSAAMAVVPDSFSVSSGDDLTFTVEVANNGNSNRGDVTGFSSSVASCNVTIDAPRARVLGKAIIDRFTCSAENIELPFTATFNTLTSSNINAAADAVTVEIDSAGKVSVAKQ